jgi:predicted GNAT family acetyltransferase
MGGGAPRIEVTDRPEEQRWELLVDGEHAGQIEYRSRGRRVAMIHTEVELASELITRALGDARSRGLQVLPHCPLVREYVKRHPEFVELVPEGSRARFGL